MLMYLTFSNLNSMHWIIKKIQAFMYFSEHFQDISGQFSGHQCNPPVVMFTIATLYHVIMGVFGILPNSPLGHQSCDHCPRVIHGGILSELLTSGEISYQSSHNQIKGLLITSNANCSIRQFGVGEELCPMSSSLSHFRRLFSSPCQRQSM